MSSATFSTTSDLQKVIKIFKLQRNPTIWKSGFWKSEKLKILPHPQVCGSGNAHVGTHNKSGRWAAKELIPDRIVFNKN